MTKTIRVYYKQDGVLCKILATDCETCRKAIWAVRSQILGEQEAWFEVKQGVMAVVNREGA